MTHGWRWQSAIFAAAWQAYVAMRQNRERPATRTARLTGRDNSLGIEPMSAPIAKSQFSFELPNLTYVDASLEEAIFRVPASPAKPHGIKAWMAAFRAWRERQDSMAELDMMSDRELLDIGLTRADVHRVYEDNCNSDLRDRLAA
jgi:uncharacterized protein YjiS (DUF1127 family)